MIASVRKYRDRDLFFEWLKILPLKYSIETIEEYLLKKEKGQYMMWTEEDGLI